MPTYDHRAVQRVRFAVETTFGADATGDVATNFFDLRAKPTVIERAPQTAPDETSVQRFHQQRDDVFGADHGSCVIEAYWTSQNTLATKSSQSKFLETVLGGYALPGTNSLSASGEAATGCVVSAGEGAQFDENSFVGVTVDGVVYPRLVATVTTDTLVWWPALPSAHATGSAILNAQNIFYDESVSKWLQILSEAAIDRGNIWLLSGCAGDLSMSLQRGGLVSWSSNVMGALHEHDDEIATPQGGGAIAAAAYVDSAPKWGNEGGCHFAPTTDSTLTLVRLAEIAIDFGIKWVEIPMPSGVEGIGEYYRDRGRKTITLTILKPASEGTHELYRDAMRAGTHYGVMFWLGATANNINAIAARNCQIIKVEDTEVGGVNAQKVTVLAEENDRSTDQTTTQRRSPMVLGAL